MFGERKEPDIRQWLDLAAMGAICDVTGLTGFNRALTSLGLRRMSEWSNPGLRALLAAAGAEPGPAKSNHAGFILGPRINAGGRIGRADLGARLLSTDDPQEAATLAAELDALNASRKEVEREVVEAAVRLIERESNQAEAPMLLVAADDWHPGVIGIVASRVAERHGRPCVIVALDGDHGTGSGRSIPAFDLLAGLDAASAHLVRHGGHRAAAGCTIRRDAVDAFRAAFTTHAAEVLAPEDFLRTERVDAVVSGDELGGELAEELEGLAPFGQENPEVSLLVPAARLVDVRPMGEGKHIRFMVEAGGARARAVAFGMGKLPDGAEDGCFDATFGLELNEWNGTVEPRLVLRKVLPCDPGPIALAGEPEDPIAAALLEAATDPSGPALPTGAVAHPGHHDRRGRGIAGTITSLVATGEPVLVVCADARARRRALQGRLGGFAICSYAALARDPSIARPYPHLVAYDPPAEPAHEALLHGRVTHLAWGEPELAFAEDVHERDLDLRPHLRALYPDLRERGAAALADRPVVPAGRCLRVLCELGLAEVRDSEVVVPPPQGRTELERSPSFLACQRRLEDGRRWLSPRTQRAA